MKTKLSESVINNLVENESISDTQVLKILKSRRKDIIQKIKTDLTKDKSVSIIKMDELFEKIPELKSWITPDTIWFGKLDYYILPSICFDNDSTEKTQYVLYLFTETTHYRIVIMPSHAKDKGWISGYCVNMFGEGMASIPDGTFNKRQMDFTFQSILAYELRTIEKKADLRD